MPELTEHLHHLADTIGPRPATTDAEALAADYIEGVMRGRGLETERQEFDAARTDSWAFVIYHVLTLIAAVASRWSFLVIPALVIAFAVAIMLWLDLDTRWGLTRVLPKGPSQNVIARHIPKTRRGERLKRIIVVAHYDSAKSSLMAAPGLARRIVGLTLAMKVTTVLVPLAILVRAMPFASEWMPYSWYFTLAVGAYLLFPLVVGLHRELVAHATDGANDNASGVAALLGIMERVVPEPEPSRFAQEAPVRRSVEEAVEADVVIEDALLTYTPVAPAAGEIPRRELGTFDDLGWDDGSSSRPSAPASTGQRSFEADSSWAEDLLDDGPVPGQASFEEPEAPAGKQERSDERHGLGDWLGLGKGFDVRREGRKIGTWDNFVADDEDDDGFGLKGGSAGEAGFEDPAFASEEAARIRRRVTVSVDRALVEKEVWFVATGAKESGSWGMQAFLKEYEDDARDALIINLDSVGVGTLHWVTKEGVMRRYHSDRRLASSAKRVAREEQMLVKLREYRGATTDATSALARGYKALTFMGFDINGRVPNWHAYSDTVDAVSEENLELATDFVTKLIREL
ncbi:MAG: M28 family peptidase [Coriobacteriia bacterium]